MWNYAENQDQFKVIAINQSLVIGPSVDKSVSTSVGLFLGFIRGQEGHPGILDISWNVVDVRDVSLTDIAALENDGASGRYVCSSDKIVNAAEAVAPMKSKQYACKNVRHFILKYSFAKQTNRSLITLSCRLPSSFCKRSVCRN
jgi:nucleoside-diphosphate-sugar epimerase